MNENDKCTSCGRTDVKIYAKGMCNNCYQRSYVNSKKHENDIARSIIQKEMNVSEAKELAEAHWEYVEKVCHMMYVDAFVHGIKHGQADKKEDKKVSIDENFGTYRPYMKKENENEIG